jgi:hypothetical protein
MSKWILGGCPRCHGDVYIEKDNEGSYERCLQCGYVRQVTGIVGMYGKTPETTEEPGKANQPVSHG